MLPATLEPPVKPAAETPAATTPSEPTMSEDAARLFGNIFALGDEQAEKLREKAKADKAADKAADAKAEPPKAAATPAEPVNNEAEAVKVDTEKPKGKPRKPAPPVVDPVDIAVQTARAMGQELGDRLTKNQERRESSRQERADDSMLGTLSVVDREKHEALVEMAKRNPEFGSTPAEFLESLKNKQAYRQEWQRSNPGKRYNERDPEHDSFFESNDPVYDEHLYAKAVAAVERRPLEEKLKDAEKLKERIEKIEAEAEVNRATPVAMQAGDAAFNEAFRHMSNDLPDALKTQEGLKAAKDSDPDLHEIVETHQKRAAALVGVGVLILETGGKGIQWNNSVVTAFVAAKDSIEQKIKALPREEQVDKQGRRFATWSEYKSLSADDQLKHWFLDQRNISAAIPAFEANEAREKINALTSGFDKRAAARGYSKVPAVPPVAHTNGAAKEEPKPAAKPPESPSAPAGKVQVSTTKTEDTNVVPEYKRILLGYFNGTHS